MALTLDSVKHYMQGRMIKCIVIKKNKFILTMLDDKKVIVKYTEKGVKLYVRDRAGFSLKQHEMDRYNDGIELLKNKMRSDMTTGEFTDDGNVIFDSIYSKTRIQAYEAKQSKKKKKQKVVRNW